MRYVKPYYYNDFKCIADKCPDTCCAGWQIVIDDETLEKYSNEKDEFSYRLKNSIDWGEGVFFQNNGRCAMLNDNNLCDLVTAKGEGGLCRTCHMYPRHIEEFEGVREYSLSLSCPVAARIILEDTNKLVFDIEENEDIDPLEEEFEDFDFFMYTQLEQAREVIFEIIQNRDLSVDMRMSYIMDMARKFQNAVDEQEVYRMEEIADEYKPLEGKILQASELEQISDNIRFEKVKSAYELFKELEVLRQDWPEIIEDLKKNLYNGICEDYSKIRDEFYNDFVKGISADRWGIFKEQLLMFFVYTYFLGSVYDDLVYSKLALSTFSVCFIEEIIVSEWLKNNKRITLEKCIEISYRYAREVEHSDDNLNILEEMFMDRL
jgi:lysine-N-methylase